MISTAIKLPKKVLYEEEKIEQPKWQRIILLLVLGYEAAGCLLGGILLIAAPDGRMMDMPIEIMHGVFHNFTIPGFILFGLGILITFTFATVLIKMPADWFMACLALGGLSIWFVTEIIILRELHWLHLMWGFPVLIGWIVTVPLILLRKETPNMLKGLLMCGILSSLWYLGINIFVPFFYAGYSTLSFTVSELSATSAPTRILWVLLTLPYTLLFMFFGWGVLKASEDNRYMRVAGWIIIIYCAFNFYWPPMSSREMIAAGAGTFFDILHIVWAMITLVLMMVIMAFGAVALGNRFRRFTFSTWIVFAIFSMLTWMESPGIEKNLATPWIGLWERINIGAFMLWVAILSIFLLRRDKTVTSSHGQNS